MSKACIVLLALFALMPLFAQSSKNQNDDISGIYSYLRDGESVQINVEQGRLNGWVTSFGMLDSDKDTVVDRFFKTATLNGDQIHFITKTLHGCWLEFTGRIERGEGKARSQEGYYRLVGTLTQYTSDENNVIAARQKQVAFKSAPDAMLANGAQQSK